MSFSCLAQSSSSRAYYKQHIACIQKWCLLQERYTGDSLVRVLLMVDCIQNEVAARLLACLSCGSLNREQAALDPLRMQRHILSQFRWCWQIFSRTCTACICCAQEAVQQ